MKPSSVSKKPPVGILLLMHAPLADAFLTVLSHVMGGRPVACIPFSAEQTSDAEALMGEVAARIRELDQGAGVIVFADICGATPYRVAQQLVEPGRVELVCGASVPMLVRALTYRDEGLEIAVQKALSGGHQGVLHVRENQESGSLPCSDVKSKS